ncbi:MAG: hypothetical protein KME52_30915, partial [Desmonostoc geniculatum HA4340-LM1]|nr:hypothetical protein [Desmonostoc geniculatum HA4340-LM1]
VWSCSRVRNTLKRAPIYQSPHLDAFSVFTYLYIVWFFYAHLLTPRHKLISGTTTHRRKFPMLPKLAAHPTLSIPNF